VGLKAYVDNVFAGYRGAFGPEHYAIGNRSGTTFILVREDLDAAAGKVTAVVMENSRSLTTLSPRPYSGT